MAQGKGQLLDLYLLQGAFVQRNEAVCCEDTTLISGSWRDEEIERLAMVSLTSSVLNQALVDNAPAGRVLELATRVLHEESLVDSFVDDDESQLWRFHSIKVQLLDRLSKLCDLNSNHGISLSIAHTVSVDNEVCGHLLTVAFFECINGAS